MGFKIVCGADDEWPIAKDGMCRVHNDIRCCAVCPENGTCELNCGVHGRKYGTDDPRVYCEFFAIIMEEDK